MNRPLLVSAVAALSLPLCLAVARTPRSPQAPSAVALEFSDLSGKRYASADLSGAKATVFFFSSTQCPVAQRYAPKMAAMTKNFGGAKFFLVHASPDDSAPALKKWAAAQKLNIPLVKDDGAKLAGALGATVTPEVAVLDSAGVLRYVGRLDEGEAALAAVLSGQPVKYSRVLAQGCLIFSESETSPKPGGQGASANKAVTTFSRDIAPILNKNCVSCHRAGDVGPFALTSYADAKPWASAMASYTRNRLMPPWKATPGHGEFLDSRWLSDKELNALAAWAKSGAPEGNKKDLPPAPKLTPAGSWALGTPDTALKAEKPFALEADGKDVYRNFALPMDFAEDRYVAAIDFKPQNPAVVHHIIVYIDNDGSTVARKEGKDGQPGWDVSGGGSGIQNDDWAEGWAPGMNPRRQPDGVAIKVPKGARLVMQVHYHKSGKPETDNSAVGIYWAKGPITSVRSVAPLGTPFFALKPGKDGQEVKAQMTLPTGIVLREILPHMHMLGKTMKVWATLPGGEEKKLVYIQNWDFNWQMAYRYAEPIHLPRGTKLELIATYDNTTRNPRQPSSPPKLVQFGEQTTDEMCFAFLAYSLDK